MAKLQDAIGLEPIGETREGWSPSARTKFYANVVQLARHNGFKIHRDVKISCGFKSRR